MSRWNAGEQGNKKESFELGNIPLTFFKIRSIIPLIFFRNGGIIPLTFFRKILKCFDN